MKVKFTKLAALLLAGAALFATGCTDYEVDIQKNADAIASAHQQISAMQTALSQLQTDHSADVAKLQKTISDLETSLKALIDKKADKEALEAAVARIKAIEDADFQAQIDALTAKDQEIEKTIADLKVLFADEIAKLDTRLKAAEAAIKEINEVTIPAINDQIAALKAKDAQHDETLKLLSDYVKNLQDLTAGFPEGKTIKEYIDEQDASLKAFLLKELEKYATKAELAEVEARLDARLKTLEALTAGFPEGTTIKKYIDDQVTAINNAIAELKALHEADVEAINAALAKVKADILAVKASIRSLVFVPEAYVDGVEAILIQTLNYNPLTLNDKDTSDEQAEASEETITVSPKVIAKYHVIPSNADLSFLEENPNVAFAIQANDPFKTIRTGTRADASDDFNVVGVYKGRESELEEDGAYDVICIEVAVEGTAATDDRISVVALQLTNGEETYTSDYATVYSEELNDLRIARTPGAEEEVGEDYDYHYRRATEGISATDDEAGITDYETYLEELVPESCDTVLVVDEAMDLKKITEAHVLVEGEEGCERIDPAKLELKWKFELVDIEDYDLGDLTYVTLNEETDEVTATIDAMDLTPTVRVSLVTDEEEPQNAQIAYIKMYVAPLELETELDLGQWEFSCEGDTLTFTAEDVYTKLGMTEETFKRVYPDFTLVIEEEGEAEEGDDAVLVKAEAEDPEAGDAEEGEEEEVTDTVEPDEEVEDQYNWIGPAEWIWNNAVDEADFDDSVEPLTRDVYFVNPTTGAKITVTLKALPAEIKEYRVNARKDDEHMAHYYFNYWNEPWLTAAQYNVAVPQQGETDPELCQFINNINAAFVTNDEGVIDLTDIGMPNVEVSGVEYYFCISDMKKITNVRGIEVEFGTNDPDSLVLTATVDGVTEEIAYIDNNYDEDKIPNIVKLNKESDIAKLLLNTNDAELVAKNPRKEAFFYILIGGKAEICGDDNTEGFKVPLKWQSYPGPGEEWLDHFRADYIRPINLTKKAADNFVDAVDLGEKGSFISIKSLVAPKDWRGREFGLNENDLYYEYWSYYGVFKITADIENTTCDLNNEPGTKVPVTVEYNQVTKDELLDMIKNPEDKMRDKDGQYVAIVDGKAVWGVSAEEAMTITEYIDYLHPESSEEGFGFLYYHNNGTFVNEFTLDVPVKVEYGWGVIEGTHIEVPVQTTIKE